MNLTFVTGLMGSGKSAALIEKFKEDKKERVAFSANLTEETGSLGLIESRNGQQLHSLNLNVEDFESVIKYVSNILDVPGIESIYIDEVQFLPTDMVSKIYDLSYQKGVSIHFYGLLTTFTGSLFESSEFLLTNIQKENITELPIECQQHSCNRMASYNGRIVDGKVIRSGETFVQSKSKYLALCKEHYFD